MPSNMPPNVALIEQITSKPLLVSQDSANTLVSIIDQIAANDNIAMSFSETMASQEEIDFWNTDAWEARYRPYNVANGVLQIPVMGALLNRFPYQLGRWATGYKYIEMAIKRGLADGNVKAIAFVIDSPGGEVAGCFELCEKIFEASAQKPTRAFAADHAYSAAFAIAASCDRIIVTKSGGVGSVGVVTAHVDYSGMLKNDGIKITFIFAGSHKVDGNPYEKLSDSAKQRIQGRINKIYGVFCSHVALGRTMEDADVRATEALTYDADEAIEIGFADKIGALEDEMAIFAEEVNEGDEFMTNMQPSTTGKKMNAEGDSGIDQAAHEAAVTAAQAKGFSEGTAAANERFKAILQSDAAKTRPKAAVNIALTSMASDEALTFLATLPEESPVAAKPADNGTGDDKQAKATNRNHFAERMDAEGGAGVQQDPGQETGDEAESPSNSILAAFGQMSGRGPKRGKAA